MEDPSFHPHVPVDHESENTITRLTADGRKLTYRLTVIQQPERARACGQGAKSSADRRPVDPPPIVELKIFEGDDAKQEVTQRIDATYFLYAELQLARKIAKPKNHSEKSNPPVLTGTPVAGMTLLERPTPAGYFIFSDLSVRHEQTYRLNFSLFEQLKHPEDADHGAEPSSDKEAFVTHRMEVKSLPFQVFSAKKFPGLVQSTKLSKELADQGCRVRIRRDVRMRRREQKASVGGADWDQYEEQQAEARSRLSATPSPGMPLPHPYSDPVARPGSASNGSHHTLTPHGSRRPSMQDVSQGYLHPQYAPGPNVSAQAGQFQTTPYLQQHHSPQYVSPPPPQQGPMPPPHFLAPSYQAGPPPPPAQPQQPFSGYQQVSPSTVSYGSYETAQPSQRSSISYSPRTQPEPQRLPMPPPPAQAMPTQAVYTQSQATPSQPPYSYSESKMNVSDQAVQYPEQKPRLPSAFTRPAQPSIVGQPVAMDPVSSRASFRLPPLSTTDMVGDHIEPASPVYRSQSAVSQPRERYDSHKRSYGNVFNERHQQWRLQDGARPRTLLASASVSLGDDSLTAGDADDDDDDAPEIDLGNIMEYKRADGRRINRALPAHH